LDPPKDCASTWIGSWLFGQRGDLNEKGFVEWARMKLSARLTNQKDKHDVTLETNGREHSLIISPKPGGFGSSANGGELLFLALATCYCNDLYREAGKRKIEIDRVQVEVSGEFGTEGEPARNVSYRALVEAKASEAELLDLMRYTDTVAEIQNTLRRSSSITLAKCEARDVR
jgi:organic hydroperoxide reductase OsmC/OhrA